MEKGQDATVSPHKETFVLVSMKDGAEPRAVHHCPTPKNSYFPNLHLLLPIELVKLPIPETSVEDEWRNRALLKKFTSAADAVKYADRLAKDANGDWFNPRYASFSETEDLTNFLNLEPKRLIVEYILK